MAFRLLIRGPRACFRRPEFSTDLISYDAMPPVAARNILNAVHGPPAIRWFIDRIAIINPIRRQWVLVDHRDRAGQRRANALVDVAYVVTARLVLTQAAGAADTVASHTAMFARRAGQGRFHHPPFLGLTEFAATLRLLDDGETPGPSPELAGRVDLGWMLYDFAGGSGAGARFFRAVASEGTIDVPAADAAELAS